MYSRRGGPDGPRGPPPGGEFRRPRDHPMGGPPPHVAAPSKPPEPEICREKTCPLLLRVFFKYGGHHRLEEYQVRGQEPADEVQVYTWADATLRELTDLVKEVQPQARRPNARLNFAFVYPDRRGRNVMRPVGDVHSTRPGPDDLKSLRGLGFQTGDFLDVAIH